jgi:hypothetical protein
VWWPSSRPYVGKQEVMGRTYCSLSFERHGPHRKRSIQQVFVAVATCLPSRCLAMVGEYTDRPTDFSLIDTDNKENEASNNSSLFSVFAAAGTCIPSRCLAAIGDIYTDRLTGTIYEICHWDEFRRHVIHTKFRKDWFRHSKAHAEGYTDRMEIA